MQQLTCNCGSLKSGRWLLVTGASLSLLLLATIALGQQKTPRPNTASRPPSGPFPNDPAVWPELRKNGSVLPRSSVVEIKSSLAELRDNLKLLQVINRELQGSISSPSWPDYETVVSDATDIRRLAIRLLRNLALPRAETRPAPETLKTAVSADELKGSVITLDTSIREFLNDPVLMQLGTVDAGQLSRVGANLETVVSRSAKVIKEVEDVAANAGKGRRGEAAARIKSRLGPRTSMQLTLECGAWSIDDLLGRPSQLKGHDSVNLGIEVQTRRHKLDQQFVLSIDDCVDGETYDKAISDKVKYVAIIKDFTSYEVKDKVFAYRATYEIGLTRNGEIEKRFNQPVSFYFVDEAGDGDFELLKGPMAFGFLPDWAKELARKH